MQRLADADPSGYRSTSNLARDYTHTGELLLQTGLRAEAITWFDKALDIQTRLAETFPGVTELQSRLAGSLTTMGWSLWRAGRPADAQAKYGRERAAWQRLLDADKTNPSHRDQLANCETNSSAALVQMGRLGEARAACERAIAIREAQVKDFPDVSKNHQGLAESLLRSGQVRRAAGDVAGASADWHRATAIFASHPPAGGEAALFEACCHAALSGIAGAAGSGKSNCEQSAEPQKAMTILHRAIAGGYRDRQLMQVEPGLDPLRARLDFQILMMDLAMPTESFVGP